MSDYATILAKIPFNNQNLATYELETIQKLNNKDVAIMDENVYNFWKEHKGISRVMVLKVNEDNYRVYLYGLPIATDLPTPNAKIATLWLSGNEDLEVAKNLTRQNLTLKSFDFVLSPVVDLKGKLMGLMGEYGISANYQTDNDVSSIWTSLSYSSSSIHTHIALCKFAADVLKHIQNNKYVCDGVTFEFPQVTSKEDQICIMFIYNLLADKNKEKFQKCVATGNKLSTFEETFNQVKEKNNTKEKKSTEKKDTGIVLAKDEKDANEILKAVITNETNGVKIKHFREYDIYATAKRLKKCSVKQAPFVARIYDKIAGTNTAPYFEDIVAQENKDSVEQLKNDTTYLATIDKLRFALEHKDDIISAWNDEKASVTTSLGIAETITTKHDKQGAAVITKNQNYYVEKLCDVVEKLQNT